ncbi:MAG TPA: UDP-N-acetylmuramoyl-tripeptide--D-alanyl-D-alanine ligase [Candidatus Coprosoma intestinipullorum]|uniref:UDP-N-acetylmuramoyl-tripeptide--D-alanyl-D-alanine ligase n=1 Tax=Candidatus Coprosoma intestinipullorum TaxID=2840752 RepID=A0A9D1CXZ2_9FIRM|nr:UDP-N-acetylmuramoyl-tripeptide--D-alanyl-D-alanine ligase [Candidatus Coprosoma intestinipullorum]
MNLSKLAEITNGKIYNNQTINIKNIKIDSNQITEGDLFIAIIGQSKDGHDYIESAIKNGASAVITSKEIPNQIPYIKVADVTIALGQIASYIKEVSHAKLIAITGSTGKTTTKELVYSLLKNKYSVLKTDKNQNNHIGVPLTLLKIKNEDFCIVEMGMNHLGEISYLSKLAKPDLAVITNIGSSHIGNLGSKENILKAKLEIKDGLKGDLIVSGDDSYLNKISAIKVGFNDGNDFKAYNLETNLMRSSFWINYQNEEYQIKVNLPAHLIDDVLISIYIALKYEINIQDIITTLENFQNIGMRLTVKKINTNTIISDCYNSSFESLTGDLTMLIPNKQKKLLILGDIAEAGKFSKTIHENLKPFIEKLQNYELILIGPEMMNLQINKAKHFKNYEEALIYLKNKEIKNTLILIKGSRIMKLENISDFFLESKRP